MTSGTDRRQVATDSLVGAAEIAPQLPPAPQMQVPNTSAPNVVNSASAQLNRSISQWVGSKFQERANVEHEAAVFEGEMAFLQGRTFEDLEMEGDRWALQGYRVMDAEARSSTMLAAQQNAIRNGDYAMGADEYRDAYVNRLEQQLEGLDPQTAGMVREQMYGHMPTLVRQQTAAHAQHLEQRSYDALVNAIHPMSTDPSATADLLALFTGGEGSPASGLSPSRQLAAGIDGITRAFEAGNPQAYQRAAEAGVLDRLPRDAQERLETARAAYEREERSTWDATRDAALVDLDRRIAAGDVLPADAVREMDMIFGRDAMQATRTEARAAFTGAQQARDSIARSDVISLESAAVRGEWATYATLTSELSTFHQSGTNLTVFGTVGPDGRQQITPAPPRDPGLGVRPSDGSPQENTRVRSEYWLTLVSGQSGHIGLHWEAGDLEAAAIAQSAGVDVANAWIASGRDNSTLPRATRTFAENMMASATGADLYYTAAERIGMANDDLSAAQAIRDGVDEMNAAASSIDYGIAYNDAERRLEAGTITSEQFRSEAAALRDQFGVQLTQSVANSLVASIESGVSAAIASDEAAAAFESAETLEDFQTTIARANDAFLGLINTPGITEEQITSLQDEYLGYVDQQLAANGLHRSETDYATTVRQAAAAARTAQKAARQHAAEQVEINEARATRTVGSLSDELQARNAEQHTAEAEQLVDHAIAAGELDETERETAVEQAVVSGWIQSGTVPPNVADRSIAALTQPFAQNGEPNPRAMATILQWAELSVLHPDVADTMFGTGSKGDEARTRAQVALAMTGVDVPTEGDLGDALIHLQTKADASSTISAGVNLAEQNDQLTAEAFASAGRFMGRNNVGTVQGLWDSNSDVIQTFDRTSAEEDVVLSEDFQNQVAARIVQEAIRVRQITPGMTADFYSDLAAQNVLGGAAMVGESIVFMDRGFTLKEQMFGEYAPAITQAGIEQTVIVQALRDLQASDPDRYGYISDLSAVETLNLLPGNPVAGALSMLSRGEDFIGLTDLLPEGELSSSGARQTMYRGVRPFEIITTDDRNVGFRIILPSGLPSDLITLDLAAAGRRWLAENPLKD